VRGKREEGTRRDLGELQGGRERRGSRVAKQIRRAECVSQAYAQGSAFLATAETSRDMPAKKKCAFGTGGKKAALRRRWAPC
jgi:hypothetical protein